MSIELKMLLFTVGLLSVLDAIMDMEMAEIVGQLPLEELESV